MKEWSQSVQLQLKEVANTIRGLSMDAIEAAGCGHPGLPLGCAEIAAYLYGFGLSHYPQKPDWQNRDRFILSAGHGSMLLYSALHLAGFGLSLDDLKQFRQLHSPTAGHPEFGDAAGIETTTGPLGQGLATATGIALGQKMISNRHQLTENGILDSTIFVLASDGCIMEGISSESGSLAGHLGLDNLVVFYDSNDICLDGPTSECLSEDTEARYRSYGWDVYTIDGHDLSQIHDSVLSARKSSKPVLIIAKTTIGFGSPNLSDSSEVHGKAMGADEVKLTKDSLGIPVSPEFHVPETVRDYFKSLLSEQSSHYEEWAIRYNENATAQSVLSTIPKSAPSDSFLTQLSQLEMKEGVATRNSSQEVLQFLSNELPYLVGGSADLSCSDNTMMKTAGVLTKDDFSGRNIKYGVREFAMGAMTSGMALQGNQLPYCGTFLMFSDYMRNAIRLAALMGTHVVYQFTHDSVLLGEDGPTHQPVEHLASLRAIPNLTVIRPGDPTEVKAAWATAVTKGSPVALILSRQKVASLEGSSFEGAQKGAYIIKSESQDELDLLIFATGSELELAIDVAAAKEEEGFSVRVVSMPSWELFEEQSQDYKASVIGQAKQRLSIEAQSSLGWHKYVGSDGIVISVDSFGESAPLAQLKSHFKLTKEDVLKRLNETPVEVK